MMKNKKFLLGILALASVGTGAARNVAAPAAFPVAEVEGNKVKGAGSNLISTSIPPINPSASVAQLENKDDYKVDPLALFNPAGYSSYFEIGEIGSVSSSPLCAFGTAAEAWKNGMEPDSSSCIGSSQSAMDVIDLGNIPHFSVASVAYSKLDERISSMLDFVEKNFAGCQHFGFSLKWNDSTNDDDSFPCKLTDDQYLNSFKDYKWYYRDYSSDSYITDFFYMPRSPIAGKERADQVAYIREFLFGLADKIVLLDNTHGNGYLTFEMSGGQLWIDTLKSGETQDLYYYIPTIPTVENILTGISAKDLFGEDCTVTCTDTEKAKLQNKIGTYDVQVNATDVYGQTATATLRIHVCDINAPTVGLKAGENLVYGYGRDQLVFADLDNKFAIADDGTDFGGGIGMASYALDGTALTADRNFAVADVGTHNLVVTVSDSSGNKTDTTFTLTVVDVFAPTVQRVDSASMYTVVKVGLSETYSFGKSDFLKFFVGKDDVDGDVACALEGDYIPHKVGNYTLKVSATDKAGNKATADVPVQVIQDLPPVFILSDTLVEATTKRPLTTAEITAVVTNGILSGEQVKSVSVDASAYVGNEDKVGTYPVNYTAIVEGSDVKKAAGSTSETRNGTFMIKVNDPAFLTGDNATHWYDGIVKFFKGIGNFFKVSIPSFFRKLGNWISGKGFKLGE